MNNRTVTTWASLREELSFTPEEENEMNMKKVRLSAEIKARKTRENTQRQRTDTKIRAKKMGGLRLVKPNKFHDEDIARYRAECMESDGHINGSGGLENAADINVWIELSQAAAPPDVPRSQFLLMKNGEERILGMANIRHVLDADFAEHGGHIGYSIRPSERRKGYGKELLSLALEECQKLGISCVLLTCAEDNEASRRMITALGGIFERLSAPDEDGEITERYWIEA